MTIVPETTSEPSNPFLEPFVVAETGESFSTRDQRIADFLSPLKVEWIAELRRKRPFYWDHLERRALAALETVVLPVNDTEEYYCSAGRTYQIHSHTYQSNSYHLREPSEYLTPGEYLRPSQARASIMERVAPDWLGWLLIGIVSLAFFGQMLFPSLHDSLHGFLKGLLP